MANHIDVYLEIGPKRTFAGAIEWPGWCRSGQYASRPLAEPTSSRRRPSRFHEEAGQAAIVRASPTPDWREQSALQALLDYAPRYAAVLRGTGLGFTAPTNLAELKVVQRLNGDASTDFGAPGQAPAADSRPVTAADIKRWHLLLKACWRSFDAAVEAAKGKTLTTGPRGGGRDLQKMVEHVLGGQEAYVSALGWKFTRAPAAPLAQQMKLVREATLAGLGPAAAGELSAKGPRGGKHWSPRYFVRRVAWHLLDHAWELEDRMPSRG